jgi:CheY-like chemotaxis protein
LAPVETRNILLVEDEPLIALAEKKRLERFGYAVATVGSGEKAIESINGETKFDLIPDGHRSWRGDRRHPGC